MTMLLLLLLLLLSSLFYIVFCFRFCFCQNGYLHETRSETGHAKLRIQSDIGQWTPQSELMLAVSSYLVGHKTTGRKPTWMFGNVVFAIPIMDWCSIRAPSRRERKHAQGGGMYMPPMSHSTCNWVRLECPRMCFFDGSSSTVSSCFWMVCLCPHKFKLSVKSSTSVFAGSWDWVGCTVTDVWFRPGKRLRATWRRRKEGKWRGGYSLGCTHLPRGDSPAEFDISESVRLWCDDWAELKRCFSWSSTSSLVLFGTSAIRGETNETIVNRKTETLNE